jgi:hypothetical protein
MRGYGMMQGDRLERAQALSRRRQQMIKQLASATSRRRLLKELERLEGWNAGGSSGTGKARLEIIP